MLSRIVLLLFSNFPVLLQYLAPLWQISFHCLNYYNFVLPAKCIITKLQVLEYHTVGIALDQESCIGPGYCNRC